MTDIDALVEQLLENKDEISKGVKQESIDVYKFLMAAHRASGSVNENVFRFVYRSFYGLDRWLTPEMQDKYFVLLKKHETSLEEVLEELYKHKSYDGKQKYHLSFATKLLHTVNDELPIYDTKVNCILKLATRKPKLDSCTDVYKQLKEEYVALLKAERVKGLITELKKRYDAESISDVKALDFVLWSLGGLNEKERKDGNRHQTVFAKS